MVDSRYLANIAAVQHIILFTDIIFYWHHVKQFLFRTVVKSLLPIDNEIPLLAAPSARI